MSTAGIVTMLVIHALVWATIGWKAHALRSDGGLTVGAVTTAAVLAGVLVVLVVTWAT